MRASPAVIRIVGSISLRLVAHLKSGNIIQSIQDLLMDDGWIFRKNYHSVVMDADAGRVAAVLTNGGGIVPVVGRSVRGRMRSVG